jgi:hypothetical protein
MFLSLADVCGGMNRRDHWTWEAKEVNPQESFNKTTPPATGRAFGFKNFYYWELLYLPSKRPILHPSRGLDLLGTKVLQ